MTANLGTVLLAVETATPFGGIALVGDDGTPLGEIRWKPGRPHSVSLAEMTEVLFGITGVDRGTLSGVAVSMGPGSFTGLRIGLSFAKGLCFGTGIPIVPVSTLSAVAAGAGHTDKPVRVLLNARRNEVYSGLFSTAGAAAPKREEPDCALPPEGIIDRVREPTVFAGDWALAHRERIRRKLRSLALFPPVERMLPSPSQVGALGLRRLRRGRLPHPDSLVPTYVRPSEAELKWKERRKNR